MSGVFQYRDRTVRIHRDSDGIPKILSISAMISLGIAARYLVNTG